MKKIGIIAIMLLSISSFAQTLKGSIETNPFAGNFMQNIYCQGSVTYAILAEMVSESTGAPFTPPTMYLYNEDLSLYKKIEMGEASNNKLFKRYKCNTAKIISDKLFNDDAKVEFLVNLIEGGYTDSLFLINEDGELLKTFYGRTPQIITKNGKSYLIIFRLDADGNPSHYDIYDTKNLAVSNMGNAGIKGDKGDKGKDGINGKDGVCNCQTTMKSAVKDEINIYPNPSKGVFNISNLTVGCNVIITDCSGREHRNFTYYSDFDLKNLYLDNAGTYFVTVWLNNQILDVKKLVVE